MSMSAVLAYVQAQIQTITSYPSGTLKCINGVKMAGLQVDFGQYPIAVLNTKLIAQDQQTMSAAGAIGEQYAVVVSLYLGDENTAPDVAQARALLFPDRFRAKFAADWTLGGRCFNTDMSNAFDNLTPDDTGVALYQKLGGKPMLQWALVVTEYIAANAPANS